MGPEELLLIGKILGPHGIRGELRVYPYVDPQAHMYPGARVMVKSPPGSLSSYIIETSKSYKNIVRIGFQGVCDRKSAEALADAGIFMPRAALPPAEPDTWYWCDLIGLGVYDIHGLYLGCVDSMIETGSNDVFVVCGRGGEVLIPAIEQVVKDIDLKEGKIVVDLPEGL